MKAVLFEAEYAPKEDYRLTEREETTHKIRNGSQVWRNPKFSIADLLVPEPKPDEVLIEVKACGYCGSDVHCYETSPDGYVIYPATVAAPIVLGHEFSGVIRKLGSGVTGFKVGDLVTAEEMQWCGECKACRSGLVNQCRTIEEIGFTENGGMAEYTVCKARYVWKINDLLKHYGDEDKAFEAGAMVEPTGVAYNAIFNEAGGFRPGAFAVVIGSGPIGLCSIALLKAAGAARVVAFEVGKTRAELAAGFGADRVFDPIALAEQGQALADVILDETDGEGTDVLVEASGVPELVLPVCTPALAMDGKVVQIGRAPRPVTLDLEDFIVRGATLAASIGHSGFGTFGNVIRLMASGSIDVTPAITGRYKLEDALEGFERLGSREDAKVMIRM
jgi:scyllo-inosose 3-dehydrogenase